MSQHKTSYMSYHIMEFYVMTIAASLIYTLYNFALATAMYVLPGWYLKLYICTAIIS